MLEDIIKSVSELRTNVESFYGAYSQQIKFDKGLDSCFKDFFKESNETLSRLRNPMITIATVGTTTSGKSTILNGFIGRNIAPCNIDEMSAGILTFTPSETENKLIVKESPEGYWFGKTYQNMSDDNMRSKIESIFGIYKSKKSNRVCSAPQIEVVGKFLWNVNKEILDLPENIKFRFIDLPGLRREKGDRKNLKVIQDVLKEVKPLCVLAMDYSELSRSETLGSLLSELTETIDILGGSTESIIFILNKVDLYNEGQSTTLNQDIEKFRKLVIAKLSTELPKYNFDNIKIIPYIGILQNNAQIAIGLQNHRKCDKLEYNPDVLSLLSTNCSKVFQNSEKSIRRFFNSIIDDLAEKEPIENDDLKKLLDYAYEVSYANQFIEELKHRIKESFYEIVIYPATYKLHNKFNLLCAYLKNFLSVNRLRNQIQIHSRIFGILNSQVDILGVNECQKDSFLMRLDDIISEIASLKTVFDVYKQSFVESLSREAQEVPENDYDLECAFLDKLHQDQGWILHVVDNDSDILQSITDELTRKKSLLTSYTELRNRVGNAPIEGELRARFQHTVNANLEASNILTDYAEFCKNHPNDAAERIKAKEEAQNKIKQISHEGISVLYSDCLGILSRIKDLINYDLLDPFKKVYPITSYTESDFERELTSKGIKKSAVERLGEEFSTFRKQFSDWQDKTIKDDKYVLYSGISEPNKNDYCSYTREYWTLNNEMRQAIVDLMGYNVQLEYKGFVENLKNVLANDTQSIINSVNKSGFDVNVASIISLLAIECQITPEIPEDLFTFADAFEMGKKTVTRVGVNEGVCCDDYYNYDVEVYTITYPTNDGLNKNWNKGISGSENGFWNIVVEWVANTISLQHEKIESAINKVSTDILENLTEQNERLRNGSMRLEEMLNDMESKFINEVKSKFNNLCTDMNKVKNLRYE